MNSSAGFYQLESSWEVRTRLRRMEAAHDNIRNKAAELGRLARRMRQDAVSAEILEVIGAAEAMKDG